MSSFKSSENIQKIEGGPDKSVSNNNKFSSVTLNELAMKARLRFYFLNTFLYSVFPEEIIFIKKKIIKKILKFRNLESRNRPMPESRVCQAWSPLVARPTAC